MISRDYRSTTIMSLPPNIDTIFDIDEGIEEVEDMEIVDEDIDLILNAMDGVGHVWERVEDDVIPAEGTKETQETERVKTHLIPVEEYVNWIKDLEKAGLSYVKHDRRNNLGNRKKFQWMERWYCHRYGTYKSVAGKDLNKKPRLAQKETKKCGCKSYIYIKLPIGSSTVILYHYYKHLNHHPGSLSDLCTLRLSDNIRHFVQKCALEGLDCLSIQKLLRFRAIELQDQIRKECCSTTESHLQDIQMLRDGLITKDDIYTIVHNTMKSIAYFDEDELKSLKKWQERLIINMNGNCLFEQHNNFCFLFAFQTKEQKELMKISRVLCLDGTHGMNHCGYYLFSLVMRHPTMGNGYPIAFLISEFKQTSTLKEWFNFLKYEHREWNPDIFMVDDTGEEIKAVKECFPNSSVFLCHFHVLRSWRKKLGHKRGTDINPCKEIIWNDLWRLMKTEEWDDTVAQEQIIKTIDKWRKMNIEIAKKFADYFEYWWKPKYEMWMVCARGIARDSMDTNNLIEAFHHKLKYTYMRGHPVHRLDGEVYLLVEIVLRDINFSAFLNELKIGRMSPQQRQQRIREIVGTNINQKDIYKIQSDTWIVHSMTNDDVEYSVRKRDSITNTNEEFDISLYVCTCHDFKTRQLPCKHIFAIFTKFNDSNSLVSNNISTDLRSTKIYEQNAEIIKLQEDLTAITAEWKDKSGQDIHNLRTSIRQAAQMERTRLAKIEIIPQVSNNNKLEIPQLQLASNIKFKKQNRF